ncbi:NAD(P)/FAD-dependent oxidoreductase [Brevibacterium jeotgali]|uniref:Thioredoxin reductase n=1 Tax=Brevibacterium jeotgali TaxID=1262550 RepID=A0A2H1L5J2_9MICO|nr:NAD(P)/FAD-dependent oxidoreductase [Brevibacterium jeotgali]TWC01370.1 thioredoxin reductase [Brevibacterium jeotgali]SMY12149.1 Thioredoxin reductase [Brevibacterium jeotgali]
MTQPLHTPTYDVVVIGGGVAGLSAALTLGRALRSVLVVDAGSPRNAPAAGAHNLLGNEGIDPLELIEKGRAEARSYGAQIVAGTVTDVRGTAADGFTVTLTAGRTDAEPFGSTSSTEAPAAEVPDASTVHARRIVLASGAVDTLPDIPGLAERWGHDVIHCPYCHGHEVRGGRIGVLATGPMWLHQAKLVRQWSHDVTVLLHEQPAPSADDRAVLASRGVRIVDGAVQEVLSDRTADAGEADSRTEASPDGRNLTGVVVAGLDAPVPLDAILVGTHMRVDSALVDGLGLVVEENVMGQFVPVDMGRATNVPGVFAAGNVTSAGAMVAASMGDGVLAGGRANMDLVEEDFARER